MATVTTLETQCPKLHIENKKSPAGFQSYLCLVIHEYTLKIHFFLNINDLIIRKNQFLPFLYIQLKCGKNVRKNLHNVMHFNTMHLSR